jgi:hypothetical protein
MNREAWLSQAAVHMAGSHRSTRGLDLTQYKFSVGFPNRKSRKGHRMWDYALTEEGNTHVYISPLVDNRELALATLLHSLLTITVQAWGGSRRVRSTRLDETLVEAGFDRPIEHVVPGEALLDRLAANFTDLPPYPNEAVVLGRRAVTQSTRMLKVVCLGGGFATNTEHPYLLPTHETYLVRLSQTQLDRGAPLCGVCSQRMHEPNMTQQPIAQQP